MGRSTSILNSASNTMDRQKRKGAWTPTEDALLTTLMQSHQDSPTEQHGARAGHVSWVGIARHFENRNAKECRKRWKSSLCPGIARGSWTSAEDELLRQAMQIYPGQWAKIARNLGSRTGDQCSSRWRVLSAGAEWNEERDRILLDFVNRYGKRWAEVRRLRLPMFTNAECRNRYHRIIRRLSAEKRHETEIETLKLVCSRDAAGCPSSSSSSSASRSSLSGDSVAGLTPTSRRTSFVSNVSSCSSSSSSSFGDDAGANGARAWPVVDRQEHAKNGWIDKQAKPTMTDDKALEELMRLAGSLVFAWPPIDSLGPQQQPQERRCQDGSPLSTQHDRCVPPDAPIGFVDSNVQVAGVCDTSMPSPLTTGTSLTDGQAWTDVLAVSECDAMPTAAATPAISVIGSSAPSTAASALVPMCNIQTCRECAFEPCICTWANMWLSQASTRPYSVPDQPSNFGGRISSREASSTIDSMANIVNAGGGHSQSLDVVPSRPVDPNLEQPLFGWRM